MTKFELYTKDFNVLFKKLRNSKKYHCNTLPKKIPAGSIYCFSENNKVLYVGRSKQILNVRIKGHISKSAADSPLAWAIWVEENNDKEKNDERFIPYKPYSKGKTSTKAVRNRKAVKQN